jgi:outer membrane cobalamin receptor
MIPLAVAMLFGAVAEPAVSVSGTVVDGRTGVALADVTVSANGTSTRSDASGRFVITGLLTSETDLVVSAVGYTLARRRLDVTRAGAELIIPLSEGVGTYVEELTVTAGRFEPREKLVAAQHQLGSGDLQNLRGLLLDDPLRALQTLPGVSAADDLHGTFSLRGSGLRHIGFTLDGVPAPFLLHTVQETEGTGSIGMVNSDVLDSVSLLLGGHPQQFGNHLGGRVDFQTREGSRDRTRASAALSGTSASAMVEGPLAGGAGSWLLSARKSYLDLLLERLFPDDDFVFAFEDAHARVVYDVSARHQLQATALVGQSRFDDAADTGVGETADADNRAWLATLGWRVLPGTRTVLMQRAWSSGSRFVNRNREGATLDRGRLGEVGYRLDASHSAGGLQSETGVELRRIEESRLRQRGGLNDRLVRQEQLEDSTAAAAWYGLARWAIGSRVELGPGARIDYQGLTGSTPVSPWLQAQWQAPGAIRVSAGTGLYHQFPGFRHVSGLNGNPALRPERAWHADLGLEREMGRSWRWRATAFNREERGILRLPGSELRAIGGVVQPPSMTGRHGNALDGHARGLEVLLQRKDPNGLSGWIAYAFAITRYRDRSSGETFRGDYDQPHALNVYLYYRKSARTSFGARLRAASNFPITGYWEEREPRVAGAFPGPPSPEPAFGYFVGERRNELRLPAYSRLDLRADRTASLGRARLTLFAEITNVLSRTNYRVGPADVNGFTGRATNLTEDMFPIVPSLGLRVEF